MKKMGFDNHSQQIDKIQRVIRKLMTENEKYKLVISEQMRNALHNFFAKSSWTVMISKPCDFV
jgi:hypothetical protein